MAEGYDAGIRLGEMIGQDMVAVPISGDLRLIVVGSPAYFMKHAKPLEEYSTAFPGFYLYSPDRRHTSPALRAFIDFLLEMRRG